MNQLQRDKRAIRTILEQMGEATYPDIALRGGEGLLDPLFAMVDDGEVLRDQSSGRSIFRLVV